MRTHADFHSTTGKRGIEVHLYFISLNNSNMDGLSNTSIFQELHASKFDVNVQFVTIFFQNIFVLLLLHRVFIVNKKTQLSHKLKNIQGMGRPLNEEPVFRCYQGYFLFSTIKYIIFPQGMKYIILFRHLFMLFYYLCIILKINFILNLIFE